MEGDFYRIKKLKIKIKIRSNHSQDDFHKRNIKKSK